MFARRERLVSGDALGTVRILEFTRLKLLHVLYGHERSILALAFGSYNLRFVDFRDSECNIWEPAALARQTADEDASESDSVDVQELPLPEPVEVDDIKAIIPNAERDHILCGTANGVLYRASSSTDRRSVDLYTHSRGIAIIKVALDASKIILASADSSSRILVHELSQDTTANALLLDTPNE